MTQNIPTDTEALLETLEAHERRVWDALVKGDAETDAALLHDDFLGVYPSGFAGRAEHVEQLSDGPSIAKYRMKDLRVMPLGPGHAALSYWAEFRRSAEGLPVQMYVTSIWREGPEGWINIFSQDTYAK